MIYLKRTLFSFILVFLFGILNSFFVCVAKDKDMLGEAYKSTETTVLFAGKTPSTPTQVGKEIVGGTSDSKLVKFIKFFIQFIAIVAISMLLIVGMQYMTALGDDKAMREARDRIVIIGLGLGMAMASYAIVSLIQSFTTGGNI